MQWLNSKFNINCSSYDELYRWSVEHVDDFWSSLFGYFDIPFNGDKTAVREGAEMLGTKWFPNVQLNYVDAVFSRCGDHPAILHKSENRDLQSVSWDDMKSDVSRVQQFLVSKDVQKGDRVVAFVPNIYETSVCFLATVSLGAIWSSCSPDFGVDAVIDRFQQLEPKVAIVCDGYFYGGKPYSKIDISEGILNRLETVEASLLISFIDDTSKIMNVQNYSDLNSKYNSGEVHIEKVNFNDPIWVLFSSGTTGAPKAIVHSHGGVLLEHLKYMAFHNDVHAGERFFWYSTTGWMMWNFVHASWLMNATVVLYEGSAAYPDLNAMWQLCQDAELNHFGTSAPFIVACMKKELTPKSKYDLNSLRSIGSTGAPLPPEGFDWIYANVKKDVWLCSMSGGTDVCTAFVGGCILRDVYLGEIQCRALGCDLQAWDESGQVMPIGEVGEMVITKSMPSMPILFWGDKNHERYRGSYYDMYPNVWRHGDWIEITERDGLVIHGRSDATLNRHGIRIGTSEIYRAIDKIPAVKDSLVVNLELNGGNHFMPLFIVMNHGEQLNDDLIKLICSTLRKTYTPRHVPDEIIEVNDIPYTISGKKMEAPVKKILMGISAGSVLNKGAMRNPESLDFFAGYHVHLKEKEAKS